MNAYLAQIRNILAPSALSLVSTRNRHLQGLRLRQSLSDVTSFSGMTNDPHDVDPAGYLLEGHFRSSTTSSECKSVTIVAEVVSCLLS